MNSINEASPSRTEQYVHALNQISDGVIIVLADYVAPKGPRVVFANRAAAEMIGYSLEQMSRKYLGDFYDPQQLRHLIDRLPAVAKQDRVFQMEREVVKSDGQHEPLRWTICASPGSVDARMHCFVMTMRPLVQPTSEAEKPAAQPLQGSQGHHMPGKSLASPAPREATDEASLEARSRVESLAELASGIAHDFKNHLQSVVSSLSVLRMRTLENSRERKLIDDSLDASTAAQELAQQILDFTKGRTPERKVVNLGTVAKNSGRLGTVGKQTRFDLVVDEGLWGAEVETGQINQVLHNLITNAVQAMDGRGHIQMMVKNALIQDSATLGLPPGPYVMVSIRDHGCGIPPETLRRIFQPFFTTKPTGSGVGLALCRAIIQRHGGTITVQSKVGVGTLFCVYFPACQFENPALPEPELTNTPGKSEISRGRGKILVVDDDERVLESSKQMLEALGYEAILALDGQKAIETYRKHLNAGTPVRAVLLDMTLRGGLSGDDVCQHIRQTHQDARLIATSGWFDDDAGETLRRDGYRAVLAKPYPVERLSKVLNTALV
ncbi:MAG TPA: ATP-binding protein [Verrucomicrobiales bacterium]|nr:ATP-binding protein [Verrucomicrobiales bacterium]